MKKAIVTGITGQDGAYLAELLLEKGYVVYGTYRRTASVNFWRIEELGIEKNPNLHLIEYDLTDMANSIRMVAEIRPDEIYNLAAQSFVGVSFEQPLATAHITGLGCVHLLEAIRVVDPKIKFSKLPPSEAFSKPNLIIWENIGENRFPMFYNEITNQWEPIVTSDRLPIIDLGKNYDSDNLEGALQEIAKWKNRGL